MIRLMTTLALSACLAAGVDADSFERTYGGAADDHIGTVRQTADGGFILVGHTRSFGAGDADMYVIRTDARGDTLWTRVCGSPADDRFCSVQPTADGGLVAAGMTTSAGAGGCSTSPVDRCCACVPDRTTSATCPRASTSSRRAAVSRRASLFWSTEGMPKEAQ